MNNNMLRAILLIIIFYIPALSTQAHVVQDIRSVEQLTASRLLKWADKDTVIILELDNMLVMPKSNMFAYKDNPYRNFIANLAKRGKKNDDYNRLIAHWYQQRQIKLTDTGWSKLIDSLKANGAQVFGICSMPIRLNNIEQKRMIEMQNLGINFTPAINKKRDFVIMERGDWSSRFYNGIIFTGPYSQSKTILEFLRITKLPQNLLVASHLKHEVDNIDKKLRVFNMSFYTVHYTGAKYNSEKPIEDVVKFQQRELIQNQKWFEDDQAKAILGLE